MWLSNTWHLVRLWDGWSPIAWQDLREISGWPLVVQVDIVSNVHLDHVNMLLIAPACVPVLYFCARQSQLILVTATKLFLYMTLFIKSLIDTKSARRVCVKSPSLFFGEEGAREEGRGEYLQPCSAQAMSCHAVPWSAPGPSWLRH